MSECRSFARIPGRGWVEWHGPLPPVIRTYEPQPIQLLASIDPIPSSPDASVRAFSLVSASFYRRPEGEYAVGVYRAEPVPSRAER